MKELNEMIETILRNEHDNAEKSRKTAVSSNCKELVSFLEKSNQKDAFISGCGNLQTAAEKIIFMATEKYMKEAK